jgi:3-hydroxyisobutyrate dehydrogenase-like beta-hydroxyacid dehydrogenase
VYYVWLGVLCAGLVGLAAGSQEISSPTAAIVQCSDVVVQAKWKRLPAEGPVHHAMRKAHIDSQKPGSAVIICETAKPDRVVNCEESYNTQAHNTGRG